MSYGICRVKFRMQARGCVERRLRTYQTLSKAETDSHKESNSMSGHPHHAHQPFVLDALFVLHRHRNREL